MFLVSLVVSDGNFYGFPWELSKEKVPACIGNVMGFNPI